jgi:iron complex transport system substrate-binding protein
MYFDPTDLSTFSFYSPSDPRVAYLTDLGLTIPPSVVKLAESTDSFYFSVSAENFDSASDVEIILTWSSGDGSDLLEALQGDPLLGQIPAIKNGAVVFMNESTPTEAALAASQTPTALSIPYSIDEYLKRIAEAVDKAS